MSGARSIKFTCKVPPSVNAAYWLTVIWRGNKPIPQKVLTDKARKFKEQTIKIIQRAMMEQNIKYLVNKKDKFVELNVNLFIDKKRKDADNIFKLLQDAIVESGLIIDDDIIIPSVKNIIIDKFNPRIEVEVTISDKIGIFDNIKIYEEYLKFNCYNCKRYSRNCSRLRKMKENRIVDEDMQYPIQHKTKCKEFNPKKS